MLTQRISEGIEPTYPSQGGIFRDKAIMLLRRFYVQENEKGELLESWNGKEIDLAAPLPHLKNGRVLKEDMPASLPTERWSEDSDK